VCPFAFLSCTQYASSPAGVAVSPAGSWSLASEAPGFTSTFFTGTQGVVSRSGFLAVGGVLIASRHTSAVIGSLIGILSVVSEGVVHRRVTPSPARTAVRSATTCGNFNVGGSGGPGLAHPPSRAPAANARPTANLLRPPNPRATALFLSQIRIQPEAIAFLRPAGDTRWSQVATNSS
jgi:hypothetical protein